MSSNYLRFLLCLLMITPFFAKAQDTTHMKKDSMAKSEIHDSTAMKHQMDSSMKHEDTVAAAPPNCYKQWTDLFAMRGAKPVTDGMQDVIIAFKIAETYNCFLGRVQVVGGKIKAPLYVQTEGGEYRTFGSMGKKLDPEFVAAQGEGLWKIADGMSVLFKTTDNEYGRIFFYKFVSKGPQANKVAPSPEELIKE